MKAFELSAFLKSYKRSKSIFRRVLYDQILSLTSAYNSVFLLNDVRLRAYHLKVQARPSMLSREKVVCFVHQINGCIYCSSHIEIKTFSVSVMNVLQVFITTHNITTHIWIYFNGVLIQLIFGYIADYYNILMISNSFVYLVSLLYKHSLLFMNLWQSKPEIAFYCMSNVT